MLYKKPIAPMLKSAMDLIVLWALNEIQQIYSVNLYLNLNVYYHLTVKKIHV